MFRIYTWKEYECDHHRECAEIGFDVGRGYGRKEGIEIGEARVEREVGSYVRELAHRERRLERREREMYREGESRRIEDFGGDGLLPATSASQHNPPLMLEPSREQKIAQYEQLRRELKGPNAPPSSVGFQEQFAPPSRNGFQDHFPPQSQFRPSNRVAVQSQFASPVSGPVYHDLRNQHRAASEAGRRQQTQGATPQGSDDRVNATHTPHDAGFGKMKEKSKLLSAGSKATHLPHPMEVSMSWRKDMMKYYGWVSTGEKHCKALAVAATAVPKWTDTVERLNSLVMRRVALLARHESPFLAPSHPIDLTDFGSVAEREKGDCLASIPRREIYPGIEASLHGSEDGSIHDDVEASEDCDVFSLTPDRVGCVDSLQKINHHEDTVKAVENEWENDSDDTEHELCDPLIYYPDGTIVDLMDTEKSLRAMNEREFIQREKRKGLEIPEPASSLNNGLIRLDDDEFYEMVNRQRQAAQERVAFAHKHCCPWTPPVDYDEVHPTLTHEEKKSWDEDLASGHV
ncbi:hypothetical protein B0A49_00672 [Cryomyces minteri]|uniref:Uncharacterized protein n=1 Tax=Cryomyces minteri TaxID=331657 RepID=A0A4U0XUF4_9PEZI|nr:hypothetical protein B0A49_00672 [Cryomyces minteri]